MTSTPTASLMSRFTNDADNVQLALEQSVVSMCSSCLMFVGLVAMMLFINWKLFLVTALVLALTMVLFNKLGGRSRRFYQKQQAALGDVNGDIQEIIEGLKVVKAFTHEEQAKEQFRKLNETYRDAAQKANFYSTMIMPVSGNLMNISYALTAAFGGLLSVIQGFDLGGLVVYLNYSKQVGQPLNQISQQMTTLLSALAGAERIFEVMDTQPEVDEGTVTLVGAEKDANGTLSVFDAQAGPTSGPGRPPGPRAWRWSPCWWGAKDALTELGQAEGTESGGLSCCPQRGLLPGHLGGGGPDGRLTEVTDLAALASHGWAWKYPDHTGKPSLHLIRGTVRNVPGEDYYLTELKGGRPVQPCGLLLCARQAHPERCDRLRQPGPEDRLCGLHRRGQDHHHQPDQPLLRDRGRPHHL